jgi:mono/diheme cytochrome c family protein
MRSARLTYAVVSLALVLSFVAWTGSSASATSHDPAAQAQTTVGRELYRTYCGKCHALAAALSAGFGNNTKTISGNGGPSFNDLRIPYSYSVDAVAEPTGGHELVSRKISSRELGTVASFIARATLHHPIPARPTDG